MVSDTGRVMEERRRLARVLKQHAEGLQAIGVTAVPAPPPVCRGEVGDSVGSPRLDSRPTLTGPTTPARPVSEPRQAGGAETGGGAGAGSKEERYWL